MRARLLLLLPECDCQGRVEPHLWHLIVGWMVDNGTG